MPITPSISSTTFVFEVTVGLSFFLSSCCLLLVMSKSLAHVRESFCFSSAKISRSCLLFEVWSVLAKG